MTLAADTIYLDPADLTFFRAPDGDARLRFQVGDQLCWIDARISQLLPLSNPEQFWALRDGNDVEIGVLLDLSGLDIASRDVVRGEVANQYFLPKVISVQKVRDEYGVAVWDVITDAGARRYTVRNLRDSSVALSATRVLMTDVDGNRFEFPNIHDVSALAQDVLLKVV
jgi:hypothetical protein